MKIIDLYKLIANKEYDKLPNKIMLKGYDNIFTLREDCVGYRWYGEEKTHEEFGESICQNLEFVLRCEIEILDDEEEKKIPEKLLFENGKISDKEFLAKYITRNRNKINEIIDYLEKQRKGE